MAYVHDNDQPAPHLVYTDTPAAGALLQYTSTGPHHNAEDAPALTAAATNHPCLFVAIMATTRPGEHGAPIHHAPRCSSVVGSVRTTRPGEHGAPSLRPWH
eukprot:4456512-Amphidinium_carterae.1